MIEADRHCYSLGMMGLMGVLWGITIGISVWENHRFAPGLDILIYYR